MYPDPLKLGRVKGFMQKIDFALAPIIGLLTPFDLGTLDKKEDNGCSQFLREQSGEMQRHAPARAKPSPPQTARR